MLRIFLIVLLGVFWVDRSFGEDHPIDKAEEECINRDSSTVGMLNCSVKAQEEWDKELNKYYQLLMGKLSSEQQRRLRGSQRSWIRFRDLEFKNIDTIYLSKQGTMYVNFKAGDKMEIVKKRALQLKSYYFIVIQ